MELKERDLYAGPLPHNEEHVPSAKLEEDDLIQEIDFLYSKFRKRKGSTSKAVTERLLKDYREYLEDEDDRVGVYLGLALTQFKHGELLDNIQKAALEILGQEQGLAAWQTDAPELYQERREEYALWRQKLEG